MGLARGRILRAAGPVHERHGRAPPLARAATQAGCTHAFQADRAGPLVRPARYHVLRHCAQQDVYTVHRPHSLGHCHFHCGYCVSRLAQAAEQEITYRNIWNSPDGRRPCRRAGAFYVCSMPVQSGASGELMPNCASRRAAICASAWAMVSGLAYQAGTGGTMTAPSRLSS